MEGRTTGGELAGANAEWRLFKHLFAQQHPKRGFGLANQEHGGRRMSTSMR